MNDQRLLWANILRSGAISDLKLTPGQALILSCLHFHFNGDGEAWISYQTIARETGVSHKKSIQAALTILRDLGFIEIEDRPRSGYEREKPRRLYRRSDFWWEKFQERLGSFSEPNQDEKNEPNGDADNIDQVHFFPDQVQSDSRPGLFGFPDQVHSDSTVSNRYKKEEVEEIEKKTFGGFCSEENLTVKENMQNFPKTGRLTSSRRGIT